MTFEQQVHNQEVRLRKSEKTIRILEEKVKSIAIGIQIDRANRDFK